MKLLATFALIVSLVACASNRYEDYESAIVVSSVEYDGEPYSLGCF